ncbi:FmdB family zinc ribbon protein [Myxococcus llanfairpwllgwyngyllgogerychwyrndrobwllllantysiliogogogochensis]|uniref:Zinc ribbon domain-containing protein n=1 Tax=Myxococcus llanfairpwllgwyngyllgogerychwyrndrobwllllantysiliogogogochensis TaxID=2590453 RepID=A0A540WKC1_9BACT|nr:zinc ribbon domain-containing protein [Myxococcus sp. CA040A]TQF09448.1 zinc ribbon domain-containing protein [Myxococcus llanfairpwllgwyngyllgogerychwyrndrobwllllantysiliogogogochensis]
MPIYEYACQSCGKIIDVLQKFSDPPPATCATCGAEGPLTKMLSRSSFVLKGGGWYSDLYSSTKKDGSSSSSSSGSSSSSSTSSSSTSSTPSTPAAASTSSAPAPAAASGDKK